MPAPTSYHRQRRTAAESSTKDNDQRVTGRSPRARNPINGSGLEVVPGSIGAHPEHEESNMRAGAFQAVIGTAFLSYASVSFDGGAGPCTAMAEIR
jgi:hypothetical protein